MPRKPKKRPTLTEHTEIAQALAAIDVQLSEVAGRLMKAYPSNANAFASAEAAYKSLNRLTYHLDNAWHDEFDDMDGPAITSPYYDAATRKTEG